MLKEGTMNDYKLVEQLPAVGEYRTLRLKAGLSAKTEQAAAQGLPNSLFGVCVRREGELIGMGRVIGDAGCNFEVVDIAVHPDHQRQGLGMKIMRSIMTYLEQNAPASAYVSLIADHGAPALYARFGFELTAPASVGMAIKM